MKTLITIQSGLLTIGTDSFNAGDYVARAKGNNIAIVHASNSKDMIAGDFIFSDLKLNGVAYPSAKLFCVAFNALAAAALKETLESMDEKLLDIKDNSGYPENGISAVLTPNAATQITNQALSGSVILTTPAANTGLIYVGFGAAGATNYALEADKSIAIELSDLSRIYVKNSVAGEKVHVIGSYKSA